MPCTSARTIDSYAVAPHLVAMRISLICLLLVTLLATTACARRVTPKAPADRVHDSLSF